MQVKRISYERLDALLAKSRQARSDSIREAFSSVSWKRLLARVGRRSPAWRGAPSAGAGPEQA